MPNYMFKLILLFSSLSLSACVTLTAPADNILKQRAANYPQQAPELQTYTVLSGSSEIESLSRYSFHRTFSGFTKAEVVDATEEGLFKMGLAIADKNPEKGFVSAYGNYIWGTVAVYIQQINNDPKTKAVFVYDGHVTLTSYNRIWCTGDLKKSGVSG